MSVLLQNYNHELSSERKRERDGVKCGCSTLRPLSVTEHYIYIPTRIFSATSLQVRSHFSVLANGSLVVIGNVTRGQYSLNVRVIFPRGLCVCARAHHCTYNYLIYTCTCILCLSLCLSHTRTHDSYVSGIVIPPAEELPCYCKLNAP